MLEPQTGKVAYIGCGNAPGSNSSGKLPYFFRDLSRAPRGAFALDAIGPEDIRVAELINRANPDESRKSFSLSIPQLKVNPPPRISEINSRMPASRYPELLSASPSAAPSNTRTR